MKRILLLPVTVAAAATCAPVRLPGPGARPAPSSAVTIDTMAIRAHTFFLAHDALRGRAAGTPGADLAALYIRSQCLRLGLSPPQAALEQPVPLTEVEILRPGTVLTLRTPAGPRSFSAPEDFFPSVDAARRLTDFAGPAVYVGNGEDVLAARRPEVLRGAVAVSLGGLSQQAADSLRARGARGLVQLTDDPKRYQSYVRSRSDGRLYLDDTAASSFSPFLPSVVTSPGLSRAIVEAGAPYVGVPVPPVPLDLSLEVRVHLTLRSTRSDNIACVLPGGEAGARDTAIILTAHYDHLGVGTPDERGDSIYNGFSDNAAGVAMLLAIGQAARAHATAGFRHSLLLLFFTAEEAGLLGSDYYTTHPLWPLDRVRAVINLDAGAPPARPWNWRIAGGDSSALGRIAVDVALAQGWGATTSPATPNSDYYPFARRGVPAIFIIPGAAPYEGLSSDSSQALRKRWDHYHEADDEWADTFPFAGLERYATYAYLVARAVDRR